MVRLQSDPNVRELIKGELHLEKTGGRVKFADRSLKITKKQVAILCVLASDPGRPFRRIERVEQVWGMREYGETRTVDSHVAKIRRKLRDLHVRSCRIQTVWGMGYRLSLEAG